MSSTLGAEVSRGAGLLLLLSAEVSLLLLGIAVRVFL